MAGRIPQDFIDDLLNRTDIADVVEERITLKRTGRNYSGLCPFHQEKTPSFSVNPEKQFYYCFGCGAGGNAIGFVMEYDRIDFPQAVETLARRVGIDVPQEAGAPQKNQKLQNSYQILDCTARFYQHQLKKHPEKQKAINYLKQRGLSGEIAQRFQIGYAPPGWDNLINHLQQLPELKDKASQKELDDAGLVILKEQENRCYDRFRDRIIFPIVDMRGRVIAFGGRVLTDEKPKYLNSPETDTFHKNRELYGLYQARQINRNLEKVVIVEGYMDVVALAQFDISNAVATLGTATSEHHLTRLFKVVNEVVFCFDGDNAGRKAASRALETALALMEDGRQARFLFLPEGEDPDTLVRQEGSDAFKQRIDTAKPLSEFFFDSLSESLDIESQEGRARLSAIAMPLIEKIPGQVFQQLMKQQMSEMAGITSDFLQQITPAPEPAPSYESASPEYEPSAIGDDYWQQPSAPSRQAERYRPRQALKPSSLGTRAIRWLLHNPKLALKVDFETTEALSALLDPELSMLRALVEQLRPNPTLPTALILMEWQEDPNFELLCQLTEQELLIADISHMETEFIDCLHQLVRKTEEAKLDYLKKKNLSSLTDEEKRLLKKLLLRT
ncbi:MAG: DNA primase [Motiliproteus sp.]|nr:DNA primase [Motiliproteus sp.]MCW9053060.1 DNA primase [Motiliproteus sp.]